MMSVNDKVQQEMYVVTIEELVPEEHLVRKIDKVIDFSFIRDLVKDLYCENNGRPSIDPVVLYKIIIISKIFGINSIRKTIKEIEVNIAYRWFLRIGLTGKVPHFSTISTNYHRRKFHEKEIEKKIFAKILSQAINHRLIKLEEVFADSTPVKANANKRKYVKAYINKVYREYEQELMEAINQDRIKHGLEPLKDKDDNGNNNTENPETIDNNENRENLEVGSNNTEEKKKEIKQSTTDPESGYFHKGEKEQCFAYTVTTVCDRNGFVLDCHVEAGNVHDSISFFPLYNRMKEKPYSQEIWYWVMDSAYKTPAICKKLIDDGYIPVLPYKRPMTKKEYFKKYEYVYDEFYDCYLCPNNKVLKYKTTDRKGYRLYESNPEDCAACPLRFKCTNNKNNIKTVTRHVWANYVEEVDETRYKTYFNEIYNKRKETIERVFADGKENHGLRYTRKRGRKKVEADVTLIFACMNLKKLAMWLSKPRMS